MTAPSLLEENNSKIKIDAQEIYDLLSASSSSALRLRAGALAVSVCGALGEREC